MVEETNPAAINNAMPFIDVFDDWNEKEHPRRTNEQFCSDNYGTNVKVENKAIKRYTELLKGIKTIEGVTINALSGHAVGRFKERGISPDKVKEILTSNYSKIYQEGTKRTKCFKQYPVRIVVDTIVGKIVTVMWIDARKYKYGNINGDIR